MIFEKIIFVYNVPYGFTVFFPEGYFDITFGRPNQPWSKKSNSPARDLRDEEIKLSSEVSKHY